QQRVAVMQQAIEDRGGQDVIAKHGAPLCHELVGRNEQAAALVAARYELKKEMGAAALERQVTELVKGEQLGLRAKHQAVGELTVGFRFRERREQRGRARKEHRVAGFDDRPADGDREMRFPDARRAEDEDVFGWGEKSRRGELADQALIDRRLEFEI